MYHKREKENPELKKELLDLLLKWESRTEVGNFLTLKARLNAAELIQAHPRYNEESRANMLNLVKERTVIFLWLENTGVEDIAASFANMVLPQPGGP